MSFGDLRSLFQSHHSDEEIWATLCAFLDAEILSDDEWVRALGYIQGQLRRCDPAKLKAPAHWVDDLFHYKNPRHMLVAKHLDTTGRDIGDECILDMTSSSCVSNLSHLSMGYTYHANVRFESLDYGCVREIVTCPHLAQIESLAFTGQHLRPDSLVALMDADNVFQQLTSLDFSFNDLNFLRPVDFNAVRTHQLEHLVLEGSFLSEQGVRTLAISGNLENLKSLNLSDNYELETHHITPHLARIYRLESLSLRGLPMSSSSLLNLLVSLSTTSLETLDISAMRLSEGSNVLEVIHALEAPTCASLKTLHLDDYSCAQIDVERLIEHWNRCAMTSLHTVSLKQWDFQKAHLSWLVHLMAEGITVLDCQDAHLDLTSLELLLSLLTMDVDCTLVISDRFLPEHEEDILALVARGQPQGVTVQVNYSSLPPF